MNLSGLSNAQLLSFGQSLDALLSPISTNIDLVYAPFKQALTNCEEAAQEAISKQIAQQQTQELSDSDLKRDNLFRGMKYLVQAYLLHPETEKQEAAVELEKVIGKVGWNLHRETYDQQSALMKTLLSDLDKKHTPKLELLGMAGHIQLLHEAQDEFDALRKQQLEMQSELGQVSSMTTVRNELEQTCKDLLEILPGYYRMTGDETLGNTLPKISELIDRMR